MRWKSQFDPSGDPSIGCNNTLKAKENTRVYKRIYKSFNKSDVSFNSKHVQTNSKITITRIINKLGYYITKY